MITIAMDILPEMMERVMNGTMIEERNLMPRITPAKKVARSLKRPSDDLAFVKR